MSATIPVPVWVFIVLAALMALREYFAKERDRTLKALYDLYFEERQDERREAEQRAEPLKLWPILVRVAPKARLNDVSDALFEQGYVVDMFELARREFVPEPGAPAMDSPSSLPAPAPLEPSEETNA